MGVPGHPYDVESLDGRTGRLRFIEVKGRRADAGVVTLTRNELLTACNAPDQYIVALVVVGLEGSVHAPRYIFRFAEQFGVKEPDFSITSVNYNLGRLLDASEAPR
ncbi:MAG: hypothetical protein Kow00120_31030 [Anaerolineae bacterium]